MISFYGQVSDLCVRVQQDEGIDGEEARFTVAHQDLRKIVVKVRRAFLPFDWSDI